MIKKIAEREEKGERKRGERRERERLTNLVFSARE